MVPVFDSFLRLLHDALSLMVPSTSWRLSVVTMGLMVPEEPVLASSWRLLGDTLELMVPEEPVLAGSWRLLGDTLGLMVLEEPVLTSSWRLLGDMVPEEPVLASSWKLLGDPLVLMVPIFSNSWRLLLGDEYLLVLELLDVVAGNGQLRAESLYWEC